MWTPRQTLKSLDATAAKSARLAALALLCAAGIATAPALAQDPPTEFQASIAPDDLFLPNGDANNAAAFPGYILLTWDPPPGAGEELLFYEVVRQSLKESRDVAAWTIPVDPTNPPTFFVDPTGYDPTLFATPYRTYQFGCFRPVPSDPATPPFPWPYLGNLGPPLENPADVDMVPPGPPSGPPSGPSGAPWRETVSAAAYRYSIRAIYDTGDTPPQPRYEASPWVDAVGWRQVLIDTPGGLRPFESVGITDFYVSDARRPFQNYDNDPDLARYEDTKAPYGDPNGCPIKGNRIQFKSPRTTSSAAFDPVFTPPWPIRGVPLYSGADPVVDVQVIGGPADLRNVPANQLTAAFQTADEPTFELEVRRNDYRLTVFTDGVFMNTGTRIEIPDPLQNALFDGLDEYYVTVLETDYFGPRNGVLTIALSRTKADSEAFESSLYITPLDLFVPGTGGVALVGARVIYEAVSDVVDGFLEPPPGLHLNHGDKVFVTEGCANGPDEYYVIRYSETLPPPGTPDPARWELLANGRFQLAEFLADTETPLRRTPLTPGASQVVMRLPGAGLPVRLSFERGFVQANATAVDLPPAISFNLLETPENDVTLPAADIPAAPQPIPAFAGLGTVQPIPDPLDWELPADIVIDDTLDTNTEPPFCQYFYWYGVSRSIALDSDGEYLIRTVDVANEPLVGVLVNPGSVDLDIPPSEELPIGSYRCGSVTVEATGVVGGSATCGPASVDIGGCVGLIEPDRCTPWGVLPCLGDRVRVSWTVESQSQPTFSQFRIFRGTCGFDDPSDLTGVEPYAIVPGSSRIFNDLAVAADTLYWYRVEGFNPLSGMSDLSDFEVGFRLPAPRVMAVTPTATSLTVSCAYPAGWSAGDLVLYRRASNATNWEQVGILTWPDTTHVDETAAPGFVYTYAATACSSTLGSESPRGQVRTGYLPVTPPTSLDATDNIVPYVLVSWSSSTPNAPVSYRVERRRIGTTKWFQIGTTNATTFLDITAPLGQVHQYRVRVRLSNGVVSDPSNVDNGLRPAGDLSGG